VTVASTSYPLRSYRFRELVALILSEGGLVTSPRPHEGFRRLSDRLAQDDDQPASDVLGLTNWVIKTRTETTRDLSGGLDEASREAAAHDVPLYACVWQRPPRSGSESYVVMDLATFAKVVQETEETV
jgi:hypothetical protein